MLKVANLVKGFPGKDGPITVIDGISFAVPEGLCKALRGPRGPSRAQGKRGERR